MSAGFDTASLINQQVPVAINVWGAPNFWMRYFSPSYYTTVNSSSSNANTECRALWQGNPSYPYLGVISTPTQSRLNGSAAMGQADAQTYMSAVIFAWSNVAPLNLPTNHVLYCWLDQEYSTSLSSAYWGAWASYINQYSFVGYLPFYPTLYCNPPAPPPNCSTVDPAQWPATCWAVWSSVPLRCSNSLGNQPAWAAYSCSTVQTLMWQYWDEGSSTSDLCGTTAANVDISRSASGFDYHNFCLYLAYQP
jgi:hypothetical protein